jgi:hypothetical protein
LPSGFLHSEPVATALSIHTNAVFAAIWLGSALLFLRAAHKENQN